MINSVHVRLADAIVAELNDGTRSWVGVFTAVRTWTPWYKTPEEIESLQEKAKCAVVPLTLTTKWLARDKHQWDYGIGIDFQRIFDLTDNQTTHYIDELDAYCEAVQDFFNDGHTLMPGFIALEAQRADIYHPALLDSQNDWETLITVGVRGHR